MAGCHRRHTPINAGRLWYPNKIQ